MVSGRGSTGSYLFDRVFEVLDSAPGLVNTLPHSLRYVRPMQREETNDSGVERG